MAAGRWRRVGVADSGVAGAGSPRANAPRSVVSVPGDEVGEQRETGAVALFRVELRGEDISPRHRASKRRRIVGRRPRSAPGRPAPGGSCARNRTACRRRCRPTAGARRAWRTAAPAHVRHLEPRRPSAASIARVAETAHAAPAAGRGRGVGPSSLASNSICRPRQMPRNGRVARRLEHRLARARSRRGQRMQSGIALWPGRTPRGRRARIVAGSAVTTTSARRARRAPAPWPPSAGCPCRSRRRRCQSSSRVSVRVGSTAQSSRRAYARDGLAPSARYSVPLVDGTRRRRADRGATAIRSARPNALNTVSAWWCALSPRRLSTCSVTSAWLTKPWKNSCARSTSKSPISARVNGDVELEPRAPGEIDDDARQRLVERHVGVAVARDALLVAERLGQRLAERDADVLDGVVRVDVQVALGLDLEVDHAVPRDLVEHVVEERHAGGELGPAGAVEVDARR